jgi:hypothetical protein
VIFNGKIATPQSLLPRKTATNNFTTKRMTSRLTATEADEAQHPPPSMPAQQVIEEKEDKEPKNLSKKLSSHTSMRKSSRFFSLLLTLLQAFGRIGR